MAVTRLSLVGVSAAAYVGFLPKTETIPPPVEPTDNIGSRIVAHNFSRKRWRELMDAIAAEREAEEAAAERKPKERDAINRATEAAREAIAVAEQADEEETQLAAAADLRRMTAALEAATGAKKLATVLSEARRAVNAAQAVMAAIRDYEDDLDSEEEAILLLLS